MKTKSLIEKQLRRKTNPELVETVIAAKKAKAWREIAGLISSSRKNQTSINLSEINKKTKQGDIIVIPGKVLSQGELTKKIKIVALGFSEKAKEKLIKSGSEVISMIKEIKSNPNAKGIKILK
jgi:large subunit ribosomal protein L18e